MHAPKDLREDVSQKQPAILVFNLQSSLLCSNAAGRAILLKRREPDDPHGDHDIGLEIKRLCFRLKKLADSQAGRETPPNECCVTPVLITAGDVRYRLEGALLCDEQTKQMCIMVKVGEQQAKGGTKIDLAHYQSYYGLTKREMQVLELLSKGAAYKEVSYLLMISFHTVRDHVNHIRLKLNADGKSGILGRLMEEAHTMEEAGGRQPALKNEGFINGYAHTAAKGRGGGIAQATGKLQYASK